MSSEPQTKKSLGQHWLYDEDSLEAMCDAAELKDSDIVLEVGPGLGTLTKHLVQKASKVIAVEFDNNLANNLYKRVPSDNLSVINEDILRFNLNELPKNYKLVANIPYYLTSNFIRVISESSNPPSRAALLVQKEVAERVAAKPGSMSLLSVTAQFYWEVSLSRVVNAELFTPPPKVDSQIVIFNRRALPLFEDVQPKQFFSIVKTGFSQRRKTLLNSISSGLRLDREIVSTACRSVGIDPGRRAQTLSLDEWHNLYISLIT
jgi:16S rRNA (adenine1518-N6/adenine1519-N6)-dimethyltransferase